MCLIYVNRSTKSLFTDQIEDLEEMQEALLDMINFVRWFSKLQCCLSELFLLNFVNLGCRELQPLVEFAPLGSLAQSQVVLLNVAPF